MEQRRPFEVFKSGVISNDISKEVEHRLHGCRVDGLLVYRDGKSNAKKFHLTKFLEFLGCYHHECSQCYTDRLEVNKKREMNMGGLNLVSKEKRMSWLKKQKELTTTFMTSSGLKSLSMTLKRSKSDISQKFLKQRMIT